MKLKKCPQHGYTLSEKCKECKKATLEAHYEFSKVRSVKETENRFSDISP